MQELIDILTTGINPLAVDERQTFTGNNAVPYVELDTIVAGQGNLRSENPNLFQIQAKDNIVIQSIGVSLPYNYTLATRSMRVFFAWKDALGGGALNVGTSSLISLPFANYEISIGAFIPWPTPRATPYYLQMIISANPNPIDSRALISQIGAPVDLNGIVLPITCFVKISHNLPLV